MKNNFTIQEILLITNTTFSSKEYIEKNPQEPGSNPTPKEKLVQACWNGMVNEMLPEISIKKNNKPLTIWGLGKGEHLLYLQMGDVDAVPTTDTTLNPYIFMENVLLN